MSGVSGLEPGASEAVPVETLPGSVTPLPGDAQSPEGGLDRPSEASHPEGGTADIADELEIPEDAEFCEVSPDVYMTDIVSDEQCLWSVLEQCAKPAQKRRVELSFKKLTSEEKGRFRRAMQKEWQSWLENKAPEGYPKSRIIGSRWVLTWKKSSDPDDKTQVPKARLVLVGFQDPDLGKIATDSPPLRKESKHIILSICAAEKWIIWGADIKTAFLSGDKSQRDLYFKPPSEVKEFMNLGEQDVLRLEKAAYGLAEAPRAWFMRLTRELLNIGLVVSQLDPCVFMLRCAKTNALLGICGVHVDDLIGGGTKAMDEKLRQLKLRLPFGEFRTTTIKYTGAEICQASDHVIEVSQEGYIEKLEEVSTKTFPIPFHRAASCEHVVATWHGSRTTAGRIRRSLPRISKVFRTRLRYAILACSTEP